MALSGYTLLALVSRLFSGYLVDTYPRKKVLLVATALYAVCFGSYLVAGTLLSFTLLRTIHGAPFGTSTVANSTVAIDVLPPAAAARASASTASATTSVPPSDPPSVSPSTSRPTPSSSSSGSPSP